MYVSKLIHDSFTKRYMCDEIIWSKISRIRERQFFIHVIEKEGERVGGMATRDEAGEA